MARVSYKVPAEIEDPECRGWLERSIETGRPGPEIQAIRAHQPAVMASFTRTRESLFHDGLLEEELKELMRAYVATTAECTYCANYGLSKEWKDSPDEMSNLLNYATSEAYSHRQKIALRYADAIMWDPALADDDLWAQLLDEFTEPEVIELGYWVGFTYGGQRWIKTLGAKQGELAAAIEAHAGRTVAS
jgi:alkylhydroperoxidase family enzyme